MGNLIVSVIFGALGMGYAMYGRRQRRIVATLSGIAMMIVPSMIDQVGWNVVTSLAFAAMPFLFPI
ncbi:MAG: hypothetical protein KC561_04050 [Myxococcales bacterium]|nr:hypothetical protein [Myxococcales bacterium]